MTFKPPSVGVNSIRSGVTQLKWWIRWGDGEMGRWGDGEIKTPRNKNLLHSFRRVTPVGVNSILYRHK
ncbi:MAG: hypothetical protein F6K25_11310 [Okeania sp. SIO2G4]|uniref:hypothetical protein n=1 Tax=unclassified Okeania TaxID=2634635 RepID=UPI0013BC973C|nr:MULTISPECIES: hypothetical protein [unclassified Okeania]NEP40446.1 hypothetical protein [Okeania sp. SIO2H7]NEP72621.1 hypothetical protein [Okeania sp. SIO2G5]NEP96407.1 hypothetical protein [Okeania sp. SIO2F5]NEQ91269.1 hypothetical protein [Okeania sp. SIO2G4]